jgi:hypothetical protein
MSLKNPGDLKNEKTAAGRCARDYAAAGGGARLSNETICFGARA